MFKLSQKLKRTKHHIKNWARNFLGNNQQQLLRNAQKIELIEDQLSNQPNSPWLNDWLHRMLRQREKLLLFNQKYWGTFKRKEWLVNGDRNSRYVQQQANTRRKRKLICKLKDECGIWIDNPHTIAEKFILDYTNRFTSSNNGVTATSDLMLDPAITEVENLNLISISTMNKVKSALFSIDSSKTPGPDGFRAIFLGSIGR